MSLLEHEGWMDICFMYFPKLPHSNLCVEPEQYKVYNDFLFKNFFTLYKNAIDLENFGLIEVICGFQLNLLSVMTPRNLISDTLSTS